MRILQVTPVFEPSLGGVETSVRELTRRLVARGHTVDVLTTDETHALPTHVDLYGAEVTRVRAWPRGGDQRVAPGVARVIARGRWDIAHVQCYQTLVAPAAMVALVRRRIPYVLTFHGGGHSDAWRGRIRGAQLRAIRPGLMRAKALIATAEWEVEHYSRLLKIPVDRFRVIPNGADMPAPRLGGAPEAGTLVVSLGRAERYKGHHHTIAALPEVLRAVPDARVWVAGGGPYEKELAGLAASLGVADRVEIRPLRDRGAYATRLAGAAVATLLSEFETHPIAAIEAVALGVPVLVARNSGLAELAANGLVTGTTLDAGPAAHARQLVELIRDPPPPATVTMPSWDDAADSLEHLFADLTARRP